MIFSPYITSSGTAPVVEEVSWRKVWFSSTICSSDYKQTHFDIKANSIGSANSRCQVFVCIYQALSKLFRHLQLFGPSAPSFDGYKGLLLTAVRAWNEDVGMRRAEYWIPYENEEFLDCDLWGLRISVPKMKDQSSNHSFLCEVMSGDWRRRAKILTAASRHCSFLRAQWRYWFP